MQFVLVDTRAMVCARGHRSSSGLSVTLLACADGGTTAPFESVGTVAPQPLREIGEIGVWPGRSSRVRGATQHPAHPSEEAGPPELCGAAGRPAWPASTGCCTWPARPAADHSSPHPRRSETPRPTWMGHRRWRRRVWADARKRNQRSFSSASRLCGEGPLLTLGPEGSREQAGGPLERWVGARRAAASPARPGRVMLCRLPRKPRSA